MNSTRLAATAVALAPLIGIAIAGCTDAPAKDTPADTPSTPGIVLPAAQRERIAVSVVAPTRYFPVVQTTGTVQFDGDQSTQVLAAISGPVTRILVQPGTVVRRGQVLAYVSSPDFATAVSSYRKAAATARNLQRVADLDVQLYKNDAIARRDMEQAQTDAISAAADRDAALQQLRSLGVEDSTIEALRENRPVAAVQGAIRSPVGGTVVERLVTPGQLLQAGSTPCFTVADLSRMWVMANVFESDLATVQVGDSADISTPAWPDSFRGAVDNIAAEVDTTTKATGVRVVVPNPRQLLKRAMYVHVAIRSRRARTGILVPVSAVLRDEDNQPLVYIQNTGGGYERRSITLGSRVGDQYEISEGLSRGDRVVAQGGLFLQFTQSQ